MVVKPLSVTFGFDAIGVMTARFVSAAEMMAKVLGMPGYKFVVIGHPIANASDAELAAYARAAVEQARHILLRA